MHLDVREIEHPEAKPFIERWHYSKNCPAGFNKFFGAFLDGELYAVADYGAGSNMDKGAWLARFTGLPVRYQEVKQEWLDAPHPSMDTTGLVVGPQNCLELKRLCRKGAKGKPKIPLTQFLAICHRKLRRECGLAFVVSYSDVGKLRTKKVGDKWEVVIPPKSRPSASWRKSRQLAGGIYRAANFQYLGMTAAESHTVDQHGNIIHRRVAYKEAQRRKKKGEDTSTAKVREKYGRVPIKTPPKERWFLALDPNDAKKLAQRLLATPA